MEFRRLYGCAVNDPHDITLCFKSQSQNPDTPMYMKAFTSKDSDKYDKAVYFNTTSLISRYT